MKYYLLIISSVSRNTQDPFRNNYKYLCDQARKAEFSLYKKVRCISPLSPPIMFKLFESLIKPILVYASDIWGVMQTGKSTIDKVFYKYVRCALGVKATTSNLIVTGECGLFPPSVSCELSTLKFWNRVKQMPKDTLVNQVYSELYNLHEIGFHTWVTRICELARKHDMHAHSDNDSIHNSHPTYRRQVLNRFINDWESDVQNINIHPKSRTYAKFKHIFQCEPYLNIVKTKKHRIAISKLRCSSHTLAIEVGRHSSPVTPLVERVSYMWCCGNRRTFYFSLQY